MVPVNVSNHIDKEAQIWGLEKERFRLLSVGRFKRSVSQIHK